MKKMMVTYQVQDPDWWLLNNTLEQTTRHLGFRFEFFRKHNTNIVGYVVEIPNEDDLTDILLNSTLISATSLTTSGWRQSRRASLWRVGHPCGMEAMRRARVWSRYQLGTRGAKRHRTFRSISASVGEGSSQRLAIAAREVVLATAQKWSCREISDNWPSRKPPNCHRRAGLRYAKPGS